MSDEVQELLNEILAEVKTLRADLQKVQGLAKVGAVFIKGATKPAKAPIQVSEDDLNAWKESLKNEKSK